MLTVDKDNRSKYSYLANLASFELLLPHGNSNPERGFSVNKNLLEKHCTSIAEDSLEIKRRFKCFWGYFQC